MTLESAIVSWLWYLTCPVLVSLLLRNLLLASTNLCWPCLDLQPMASSYHPRLRRSLLGHLHSCHRGQQNSRFVGPPWEIAQAESLKQQMFVSLQFWKSKIEAPSGLHSGRTSHPGLQRAPPHHVLLRPCSPCAQRGRSKVSPVAVQSRSHPTLFNTLDRSPPGSSVRGILPERVLEWIAISSSRRSSWPRDGTHISCVSSIGK